MKSTKIMYWSFTGLFFVMEGLIPALTSHTPIAIEGIKYLQYPDYFRVMLTVFKVAGALALILPMVKNPFKEWAYAGFGIVLISACVSHTVVDGFGGQSIFPIVGFIILSISYTTYKKLHPEKN